ncbi:MAG: hypothetical protein NVS9B8_16500 [Candidatus Limnocylindrales bacterium]
MPSLIAYDASGNIVATLDHGVAYDAAGHAVGLIDFGAHEANGGEHTDIWTVSNATGSKVWPEWLSGAAHDFRVELAGPPGAKHISALIHKTSGHRRERAVIEAAIAAVVPDAAGARDIRHIVGGPTRPLHLDDDGTTIGPDHPKAPKGTPAHLPLIGR